MSFTQNNGNYNNNGGYNNQSTENKPKTNFNIGFVRGSDGCIDVKAWKSSANTLYAAISIRQMIGKDPQGRTTYETGLSKERPGVLIRPDIARSLYEYLLAQDPSRLNLVDFTPSQEYKDQTISFVGSESNVKITIKDQKGSRNLTIDATPIGGTYSHGAWKNFLTLFWKEIENAVFIRTSDEMNNGGSEDTPF